MCGRLACGLEPEQLKNCCCYKKPGDSKPSKPIWKNVNNSGKTYKPSYNICPTEVAPVLLSGSHFESENRTIAPMIFGLIPSWSKPGETSKYSTINCRIEHLKSSKLYAPLMHKGQRGIVICNGFYEWKKEGKQGSKPYFIHFKQSQNVSITDPSSWNLNCDLSSEESDSSNSCLTLLKMAALFEKHTLEGLENDVFSFTIITKESSSKMSWLHHRMPAFLNSEEEVDVWLNSDKFDENEALQAISHFENVLCYPLFTTVNVTSNKGIDCIKPKEELSKPDEETRPKTGSSKLLKNWLLKRPKAETKSTELDKEDVKRRKS